MALLNQDSLLFYDSKENVYHIIEENGQVRFVYYDYNSRKANAEKLDDQVSQMAGFIDEQDVAHVVFLKTDGNVVYKEISKGGITTDAINQALGMDALTQVCAIEAYKLEGKRNILCSVISDTQKGQCSLIRFFEDSQGLHEAENQKPVWKIEKITDFQIRDFHSEIGVLTHQNMPAAIFFFIEKQQGQSSLVFYSGTEKVAQFTENREIYWFDVSLEGDFIEAVYSIENEGNFILKYVKFDYVKQEIKVQAFLSENTNATHPIFVKYMGEKWVLWLERGAVFSIPVSSDLIGKGAFKWKESVGADLLLHHFSQNAKTAGSEKHLECRRLYCIYPENKMVGFGDYKKEAIFMPAKKTLEKQKVIAAKMQQETTQGEVLEDVVKKLEQRVQRIENSVKRCKKLR